MYKLMLISLLLATYGAHAQVLPAPKGLTVVVSQIQDQGSFDTTTEDRLEALERRVESNRIMEQYDRNYDIESLRDYQDTQQRLQRDVDQTLQRLNH